jgi:hypothetical protein
MLVSSKWGKTAAKTNKMHPEMHHPNRKLGTIPT